MKKFLSFVLAMLMAAMCFAPGVSAATDDGMSFSKTTLHPLAKNPTVPFQTIEARIHIPADATKTSINNSVIIGNNTADSDKTKRADMVRLQLKQNYICLCGFLNGTITDRYIYFDIVPSDYKDKTLHLAVVTNLTDKVAYAYLTVDGTTKRYEARYGTSSGPSDTYSNLTPNDFRFTSELNKRPYYIGGDLNGNNGTYSKVKISEIALFSDVRTEDEVKADAAGTGITIRESDGVAQAL